MNFHIGILPNIPFSIHWQFLNIKWIKISDRVLKDKMNKERQKEREVLISLIIKWIDKNAPNNYAF